MRASLPRADSVEGHHLRLELVKLLEQVDSQQQLLQQAIQRWEGVVSDAYSQKRQLERSARWLAKKNYRLEQVGSSTFLQPESVKDLPEVTAVGSECVGVVVADATANALSESRERTADGCRGGGGCSRAANSRRRREFRFFACKVGVFFADGRSKQQRRCIGGGSGVGCS